MLLSIQKVLELIKEGKSLEKIAEMANTNVEQIQSIIQNAIDLLLKYDMQKTKKKITIKKKSVIEEPVQQPTVSLPKDLFDGFEQLSTIPSESSLIMYVDGASKGNPGPSGIGIVIYDSDDRLVAKVSSYIGIKTNNQAEYFAMIRALQLAIYFKTKVLKIRTDSELVVRQILGEYQVSNTNIQPLFNEVMELKKHIPTCKIEHVLRNFNEKADYLAKKASERKSIKNTTHKKRKTKK